MLLHQGHAPVRRRWPASARPPGLALDPTPDRPGNLSTPAALGMGAAAMAERGWLSARPSRPRLDGWQRPQPRWASVAGGPAGRDEPPELATLTARERGILTEVVTDRGRHWAVQRRDRRQAGAGRAHRQDPRRPRTEQTPAARPRSGRRVRIRTRLHPPCGPPALMHVGYSDTCCYTMLAIMLGDVAGEGQQ
jgi:hypothetical protein